MLRLYISVFMVALLANCGGSPEVASVPAAPTVHPPTATPACAVEAAAFVAQIQPLAREWDDGTKLADSTPRMSLATQIESLQRIHRDTSALTVPECARTVQTRLVESMDQTITAFIDFLGQKPESTVTQSFQRARLSLEAYEDELAGLTGAPAPLRTATPLPTATLPPPPPTETRVPSRRVSLKVDGTGNFAMLGYSTNGTEPLSVRFPLPWSRAVDIPLGATVTLSARNPTGEGTLNCEIRFGPDVVAFQETSDPEGTVTCSATVTQ